MSGRSFSAIRTEGGLLPSDLLQRVAAGAPGRLSGLRPEDYDLDPGTRLNERIAASWNRMTGLWSSFRTQRERLPAHDRALTLTRQRWLLPLFEELGYGRLQPVRPRAAGGKEFAIFSLWGQVPVHLVGYGFDLDRRTAGVAGTAGASPHGLLQELLNRDDDSLWGMVSNGRQLRLLRDSARLTRQAYVEFDLETIMEGEVYADFALLWLVCHQSRFVAPRPEDCWLERWSRTAREEGTRILDALRQGVEAAITALGRGFLAHSANAALKTALRDGTVSAADYYRALLRLIYRLIFLFSAEDRELLFTPGASPAAQQRYARYYSTRRLRALARRRRPGRHSDLWQGLSLVMDRLDDERGCPELGLGPLGSSLWSPAALGPLAGCNLTNADLLEAIRVLAWFEHEGTLRPVDYRNLGSEELGSVYESLLELHAEVRGEAFSLTTAAGHARKTTGSYYTPTSLIDLLLDSALEPVVNDTLDRAYAGRPAEDPAAQAAAEQALLNLTVCDPACGSGHFLVAAAHRLARRLAQLRTGDEEPAPTAYRAALRDVIGHSIHGVDLNPMAVELCQVSLWLEGMEAGKPLSFLDHHIQCGNSLLGATPELIAGGLPDGAFEPLEGDDKKIAAGLKKRNKQERLGPEQMTLGLDFGASPLPVLAQNFAAVDAVDDSSLAGQRRKEESYRAWATSAAVIEARLVADAWCAAFVWPKQEKAPPGITSHTIRALERDPGSVPISVRREIVHLAEEYRFFHWHLTFPDVFARGGFDVVLGNPPWERVKLQEKEFFAARVPEIANAPNKAARERLIKNLASELPEVHQAFSAAIRQAEGQSQFLRASEKFPLCGRGDVNTYTVFAELKRSLLAPRGRVGCIVPTGIATDDTTKHFFGDLVERRALASLYDFQSGPGLFGEIGHARFKFCLLTVAGRDVPQPEAEFAFFLRDASHLNEPDRRFRLSAQDIALLNPNTRTCPIFRTRRDAEITKAIYRRVPVLINESLGAAGNPWGVSFSAMFHMSNDSGLFRTKEELEASGWTLVGNVFHKEAGKYLPLYEAKMVHHYNHRFGDYRDKPAGSESTALPEVPDSRLADPDYAPLPRYWVPEQEVEDRLKGKWDRGWLLGWRDITNATNERTVIAGVIPRVGVGNKYPLILFPSQEVNGALLAACLSSFVLDYAARQKIGGTTLNFFIFKQLPTLTPRDFSLPSPWKPETKIEDWIVPRILELVFSSQDLTPFGQEHGPTVNPFIWDPDRRFHLRCELDAAFFHLYGISRDDAAYILDTFPIVREREEKAFGEYRTKRVILDAYDAMSSPPVLATIDPSALPDGAWARPLLNLEAESAIALAAVLKAVGAPTPAKTVRLAAILTLEPWLAVRLFQRRDQATWLRLVGAEADPPPSGVAVFLPKAAWDWGAAVRHLRGYEMLVEDTERSTWAPGPSVSAIDTVGWADGRVRMILDLLQRSDLRYFVESLPEPIRRWIDGTAA